MSQRATGDARNRQDRHVAPPALANADRRPNTQKGGEGEGENAFSYNPQLTSLPETMANSIVGSGGIGLAKEMYKSFGGAQ